MIPRSDVSIGNLTQVGMERSVNQDYYGYLEPEDPAGDGADGEDGAKAKKKKAGGKSTSKGKKKKNVDLVNGKTI